MALLAFTSMVIALLGQSSIPLCPFYTSFRDLETDICKTKEALEGKMSTKQLF